MAEQYTLQERLAYALCTHETVQRLPRTLEARAEQIREVERIWRRFLSEADQFIATAQLCGLSITLESPAPQQTEGGV